MEYFKVFSTMELEQNLTSSAQMVIMYAMFTHDTSTKFTYISSQAFGIVPMK